MDTNELISIIVPVYNVKPYLERCFDSIVHQSYRNLEIILVDDGSTDGSGEMCDVLAAKDERVKVLHKKNSGQGAARNLGIKAATGELFGFIDSDDWVETCMYESMRNRMHEQRAEICVCGIQKVTETGEVSYYHDDLTERTVFSKEEALMELPRNERLSNSVCNKLFHRKCIEGLKFNESIAFEDNPFTPLCIARAERIAYTAEPFYNYFERIGSSTRKAFSPREFDRVTADCIRLHFYREHFPQCESAAAIAYIGSCLKVYYNSRGSRDTKKQRERLKGELEEAIHRYRGLEFSHKQLAKLKLFMLSPVLYDIVMNIRGLYKRNGTINLL